MKVLETEELFARISTLWRPVKCVNQRNDEQGREYSSPIISRKIHKMACSQPGWTPDEPWQSSVQRQYWTKSETIKITYLPRLDLLVFPVRMQKFDIMQQASNKDSQHRLYLVRPRPIQSIPILWRIPWPRSCSFVSAISIIVQPFALDLSKIHRDKYRESR